MLHFKVDKKCIKKNNNKKQYVAYSILKNIVWIMSIQYGTIIAELIH